MELKLKAVEGAFAVCRFEPGAEVPLRGDYAFWARTPDEVSLVCLDDAVPAGAQRVDAGWRLLAVAGPLDFGLTGIMARLSGALADAGVPLFAVSTFDTDYLLVKARDFAAALRALRDAGCVVA